ncbi:MAG: glycosyltransferase family 9 protein [Candidatus Omnitrophica bacterium]|nr:glycosyltransferase family 9 protein [Candidatus Omnitrophota bacterium]
MKVNTARKIDYWVGIPVCFLLSCFHKIQTLAKPGGPAVKCLPKKILFMEFSEMGSAILAFASISEVRQSYADASLYFWIFKKNKESVNLLNIIPEKNVLTLRDDNLFLLCIDILRNLRFLRKEKIDVALDMELFSRFSSILSFLTGAKTRVGFYKYSMEGLYRGDLHTHKVMYNPYIHISENFLSLVNAIACDPDRIPLLKKKVVPNNYGLPKISFGSTEGTLSRLGPAAKTGKRIVINLGINEKIDIRKWPEGFYLELIKKILEDPQNLVILAGVGECGSDFVPHERCINLIGKTSLKGLIGLFNCCDVLISHDSGIIHIASLTDIYIIALFGPETPQLYAPLTGNLSVFYSNFACSPCLSAYNHKNYICKNNECLKDISVGSVYSELKKVIVR